MRLHRRLRCAALRGTPLVGLVAGALLLVAFDSVPQRTAGAAVPAAPLEPIAAPPQDALPRGLPNPAEQRNEMIRLLRSIDRRLELLVNAQVPREDG